MRKSIVNKIRYVLLLLLGTMLSCASPGIEFTFESEDEGWVVGFADYPEGEEEFYELVSLYSPLPSELDMDRDGLLISGNNHSDDLFMFVKQEITGLTPGQTYFIDFDLEIASNAPEGGVGIGGSPGASVYMKIGAVSFEPEAVVSDSESYYRMNIDTGSQWQGGTDMVVLGTIGIRGDGSEYEQKAYRNRNFKVTAGKEGEIWIIAGTDSGFEGVTTIYYTGLTVQIAQRRAL